MSQQKQLELLNLWDAFQKAARIPGEVDLGQLWNALDEALPVLDTSNQLQVSAEAIAQIAQLFQERSQLAFEELEATTGEEGPVMPENAFTCFVRQSMQIDFSEFIEPLPKGLRKPYEYHEQSFVGEESSVVGVVDKETLLQVLEELEPEPDPETAYRQAIEVAHAEDVSAWTGAIAHYLRQQTVDSVGLSQLRQALRMPLVEVWLGLLLGGYPMESSYAENSGDLDDSSPEWRSDWFYGSEIWVDCKSVVELQDS